MRSYGASCGQPNRPGAASLDAGPGHAGGGDVVAPHCASDGSSSTPTTVPPGPTSQASRAVVQPEPAPTSSTWWPGRTSSWSSMVRTVEGCEHVWRAPIGSARSTAAKRRCDRGRKSLRGTAAMAAAAAPRGGPAPDVATEDSALTAGRP